MTMVKTLLVGAAIAAVLAIAGIATAVPLLRTSADQVATEMANARSSAGDVATDPLAPPNFYGSR